MIKSDKKNWLPIIQNLHGYRPAWFVKDMIAGLTLTAILIPVGMGYAQAAGLSAIYGLYATIVPLIAYAIFGPNRILILGPDSALAAMIAATVLPLAAGSPERAIALAGMLSIMTGLLGIAAGLLKLGFITDLLSKPVRYGYLNGIALTVLIGQLPKLLGFSIKADNLVEEIIGLLHSLVKSGIHGPSAMIGISCIFVILACKKWLPRIPGVLIAVVAATLATGWFDLAAQSGVAVVGTLPQGLPSLTLPAIPMEEWGSLLLGAAAIALVSFAEMSVLSRTFAMRGGYRCDENQEFIALGVADVAAGLFQGFPVSSSSSRTPVAESAGAKSQITGLVGALCIALLLIFAPGLLASLPKAALGAVVVSACLGIVDIRGVLRLYHLRSSEFFLSLICFVGVAFLGVVQGIFISVALALLGLIWRAWRPYYAILGSAPGLIGYHDISRHPEANQIPGLVLFRWDAPLFFANAEIFFEKVLAAAAGAKTPTRWIVVTAEPVTDIDLTAADMLMELDRELQQAGVKLCFAEMKGPVKDRLKRYGLFGKLGTENFFPTIEQAVEQFLNKRTAISRTDFP